MLLKEKHENHEIQKQNRQFGLKIQTLEERHKDMQEQYHKVAESTLSAIAKYDLKDKCEHSFLMNYMYVDG